MSVKYVYSVEEALKESQIDLASIADQIEAQAKAELQGLALQVHGMIIEKTAKLKTTRNLYIENLEMTNDGDNIWIVGLKQPAAFIENGQDSGEMIDRIVNGGKPAKVNKKGQKYKIIPFSHSKKSSEMSLAAIQIARYAKAEVKRRGLDKTVMIDGKPKIGKVASIKKLEGKDQPVGKFNQPLLAGMTIYQRMGKKGKVHQDIMTYRVISESQKGSGLWFSKGYKGLHAFEEVEKEVSKLWDEIINNLMSNIKLE
jgi:hypothetical protein